MYLISLPFSCHDVSFRSFPVQDAATSLREKISNQVSAEELNSKLKILEKEKHHLF